MSDETRISDCRFCGQTAMVEAKSEAEALHLATMQCNCLNAQVYQETHMKAEEAAEEMKKLYLDENVPEEVILMMAQNIILMRDNQLAEAQYKLPSGKKLKMKYNGSDYTIECSKADKKKVHV